MIIRVVLLNVGEMDTYYFTTHLVIYHLVIARLSSNPRLATCACWLNEQPQVIRRSRERNHHDLLMS